MRKFYQFAIAAAAVCVMAACGNKSGNETKDADSTKAEQPAQAEAPQSRDAETAFFSVTAPEGWKVEVDTTWDAHKDIRMEDVNSTETFKPVIRVKVHKEKKMQEAIDDLTKGSSTYKKGADFKAGDWTFTTVRGSNAINHCFAQLDGGRLLEIEVIYIDPENEAVKPVVESIKLK